ncbi:MAG: Peptidase C14 caspase catalytic subunit p20 [Parcubacteria group bacterium GW2011_GWE2_39_37]|nr:MAG: Peptidase C14 caspase catalytic subunit p20 [Parcubacteria group bacterium GW2011_GWE2_39_37]
MKKALVVGIDNYPSSPLHGCVNDASAFGGIIETNGDGSPNFDVRLVTDVATKSELKGLIIDLFSGNSDTALLYFSGHGFINDLSGYIVTPDAKQNDEGVSMDEVLAIVNSSKAKNKVVILDCCYSGAFGSPKFVTGGSAHIGEGVSILTSSKSTETSLEVNGHGIFTNLLLDALHGGASDLRGYITPGSVYAYIDQALGPWDQRPIFKTNITRFTPLRAVVPQVPLEVLRKLTEYFTSAEQHFPLNPSFEDTNTEKIEHKVIAPFAQQENVAIFKHLQKLQSVGLVVPVDEQHMYYAAMNSKSCKLTALGYHYWRLVKDKKI